EGYCQTYQTGWPAGANNNHAETPGQMAEAQETTLIDAVPKKRLLSAFIQGGEFVAAVCAATALGGIALLMVVDVTGRYLFNSPVPGAAEIIELAMGIMIFAALPLVTARDEHVRLDYFDHFVPARVRPLVQAIATLISAFVLAVLAWRIFDKALTVIRYGDTTPFLNIPVAPVALFLAVTAAAAAVILFVQIGRA